MANHLDGSPHSVLSNAINVAEACLLANCPQLIPGYLRRGISAARVQTELAERTTQMPAAARPSAFSTNDMEAAVARRFASQNRRDG